MSLDSASSKLYFIIKHWDGTVNPNNYVDENYKTEERARDAQRSCFKKKQRRIKILYLPTSHQRHNEVLGRLGRTQLQHQHNLRCIVGKECIDFSLKIGRVVGLRENCVSAFDQTKL
eukprot:TRINITY_DN1887_c0_g1_i1.p1 TRINITY_DN1887_c0_g1~~TRINITY_DN1887_c0_g1_i1.p1  ORF type:complete len:117 (-),score=10.10 TRINITY_DN1887_c0_g1_i1:155-505(-)